MSTEPNIPHFESHRRYRLILTNDEYAEQLRFHHLKDKGIPANLWAKYDIKYLRLIGVEKFIRELEAISIQSKYENTKTSNIREFEENNPKLKNQRRQRDDLVKRIVRGD